MKLIHPMRNVVVVFSLAFWLQSAFSEDQSAEDQSDLFRFPDVEVLALFPDAALLMINGDQVFLKSGDSSAEGVRVNWANSDRVEIQFWNDVRQMSLSEKVTSSYQAPLINTARIQMNERGQYITEGEINGINVMFIVDTGANIVAMNRKFAKLLSIDDSNAPLMFVDTPAGVVRSRAITLARVQVGEIVVERVDATVFPGEFPENILLGMSFLKSVRMQEQDGVMTLTSKP